MNNDYNKVIREAIKNAMPVSLQIHKINDYSIMDFDYEQITESVIQRLNAFEYEIVRKNNV